MPEKFQKCCKSVMGELGFLQITKGLTKSKRIKRGASLLSLARKLAKV